MGKASGANHIRCMLWIETNVIEVHTRITDPCGNETWTLWRIIEHRDRDRDPYELRLQQEDGGRFEPTYQPFFPSFEEVLREIEEREVAANEEAELLRYERAQPQS